MQGGFRAGREGEREGIEEQRVGGGGMGKGEEAEGPPPPLPAGERENPERTNPDSCNNYANDFGAAAAAGSDGRQKREGGRGTKKGGGRVSEIGSEASRGKGRKKGGRIRKGDKALELGCDDYKIARKSLFWFCLHCASCVVSSHLPCT